MANMGGITRFHRYIHLPQQKTIFSSRDRYGNYRGTFFIMYHRVTDTFTVNKASLELFAWKQRSTMQFLRRLNGAYKKSSISEWTCMGSNSWMRLVFTKSWKLGSAKRKSNVSVTANVIGQALLARVFVQATVKSTHENIMM